MAFPKWIAGPETLDSASTGGGCGYPPLALGVGVPCATVGAGAGPLVIVPDGTPAVPVPSPTIRIPPCEPLARTVKVVENTYLCIEGKFPALALGIPGTGADFTESQYGTRGLTGPISHPKIIVGSGGGYVPPELTE